MNNQNPNEKLAEHHQNGTGAAAPTPSQTLKLFMDIFQSRFSNIGSLYPAASKSAPEFQPERQLIQKMNNSGVVWGLGAMSASFFTLRYFPDWLARTYAARNNIPYQPRARMFGAFGYAFGLMFDSVLSMMLGASTTMAMTDVDAVKRELANVPLIEGRSVLSELLCQDYINAYHLSKKKGFDWNKYTESRLDGVNGTAASKFPNTSFEYIETFVNNCQQRRRYEEELRREQGLPPDQPVIVPSPGVPISNEPSSFEQGGGSSTFEDFQTLEKEQNYMEFDMDKRGSNNSAASGNTSEWVDNTEDMSGRQVEGQSRAYRSTEFERAAQKEAETSSVSINDFDTSEDTNSSRLPEEKKKRRWWGGRG